MISALTEDYPSQDLISVPALLREGFFRFGGGEDFGGDDGLGWLGLGFGGRLSRFFPDSLPGFVEGRFKSSLERLSLGFGFFCCAIIYGI